MKYKHFQTDSVKVKDATKGIVTGYGSQFMNVDSYGDRVFPEAFDKTLQNRSRPVRMRWNHHGAVIGKWDAITPDDAGLYMEGSLTPGHSVAEDTKASILHGAIDGMSIGYIEKRVEKNDFGGVDIYELDLIEVSIVEEPANLGASITAIKAIEELDSIKEIERYLRDGLGLSQKAAMTLISRIKNHRDGDVIDCSGIRLSI
jgi:hypothetical protein